MTEETSEYSVPVWRLGFGMLRMPAEGREMVLCLHIILELYI